MLGGQGTSKAQGNANVKWLSLYFPLLEVHIEVNEHKGATLYFNAVTNMQ